MNRRNKRPGRHYKEKQDSQGRARVGHSVLDPYEVHEYEKNRLQRGQRFGKKWFPETKGE
jgi:hypothetical protein